jgi:hypothetical protein
VSFPLAQTIGHAIYTPGSVDSHNNPIDAWASPVNVAVYGYGPPVRTEEAEPGGTQVMQGIQVLAPVFAVDPRDRFVIAGITYELVGEAANWDHGPFGYQPGMLLRLRRVEGGR